MLLEGDISVLEVLKEKRRLQAAGEPSEHIRPLLIIDGGLMKGAYGAGAAMAIHERGYTDVFTHYAGVSSGAVTVTYLLSGNLTAGKELVLKECCSREFVNLRRFWNIMDPRVLERVLTDETGRGLNTPAVLARSEQMYIGLAEHATGRPVLFQPQTAEELVASVRASISLPGGTSVKTYIRGTRYTDGASTFPLAIERMMYDIDATHILYLTNQDKHTKKIPIIERFMNNTLFRWRMPKALRTIAGLRWELRHTLVQRVEREKPKPILISWGDGSIASLEQDPTRVDAVIERSRAWWNDLLR